MHKQPDKNEFDAIVVGTGSSGATIARELSKKKKRVLMLERGGNAPLRESILGFSSIFDAVPVSDKLAMARALTTGGTTALYFAAVAFPPVEAFLSLGIDLSKVLEEAQQELPIAPLPDAMLGVQVLRVRDSALELGYSWKKSTAMLIDQSKCTSGYNYEAKWTARNYVREAIQTGAVLINHARVLKVLVEKKRAVGVEYKLRKKRNEFEIRRAYAGKIILSAGALASPVILRASGINNVVNHGFYCDPNFIVTGFVPGLKGGDFFSGSMGADSSDDGILLADGCLPRAVYRMFMLEHRKFTRLFSHAKNIGVGVMVKDSLGGEMTEDGRYYKQLTKDEREKLKKGEKQAIKIIENAGGKHIFRSGMSSANAGGMLRIGEHLDERLQTEYDNLYVCDGSVIPENIRLPPTLTLICLGKYLAKHLATSL